MENGTRTFEARRNGNEGKWIFSKKDKRWSERKDVFLLAEKYLPKYRATEVDVDTIIDLAKAKGFWSVWMIVFESDDVIVQRLKAEFAGTNL